LAPIRRGFTGTSLCFMKKSLSDPRRLLAMFLHSAWVEICLRLSGRSFFPAQLHFFPDIKIPSSSVVVSLLIVACPSFLNRSSAVTFPPPFLIRVLPYQGKFFLSYGLLSVTCGMISCAGCYQALFLFMKNTFTWTARWRHSVLTVALAFYHIYEGFSRPLRHEDPLAWPPFEFFPHRTQTRKWLFFPASFWLDEFLSKGKQRPPGTDPL